MSTHQPNPLIKAKIFSSSLLLALMFCSSSGYGGAAVTDAFFHEYERAPWQDFTRVTRGYVPSFLVPYQECPGLFNEYWWCAEDQWVVGERRALDYYFFFPRAAEIPYNWTQNLFTATIVGSDMGFAVDVRGGPPEITNKEVKTNSGFKMGRTISSLVYMGDTWGNPDNSKCASYLTSDNTLPECDDLIGAIVDDGYPGNGIDYAAAIVDNINPNQRPFVPVILPGVHYDYQNPGSPRSNAFDPTVSSGYFSTPTGAAMTSEPAGTRGSRIVLFYASASLCTLANPNDGCFPDAEQTAYVSCSDDGVNFDYCNQSYGAVPSDNLPEVFSKKRFIAVQPIALAESDFSICDGPAGDSCPGGTAKEKCTLCNLKDKMQGTAPLSPLDGLLIYGLGQPGLQIETFMAYIQLYPNSVDSSLDFTVYYYTGSDSSGDEWVLRSLDASQPPLPENEEEAAPIITTGSLCREVGGETSEPNAWKTNTTMFSVQPGPSGDYLVMLLNYNGEGCASCDATIQYRTAKLIDPDLWTCPRSTGAVGYGPEIIGQYTEQDGTELRMYHFISSWSPPYEPYGVFSRPLLLLDPSGISASPPEWPPEEW